MKPSCAVLVLIVLARFATANPLPRGVASAQLTFELDMSVGRTLAPSSVAPDIAVGVTDDLAIAVVHSGAALTGFRGSAGWGLCMSEASCRSTYTAGGVEATYGISRGTFEVALNAGLLWTRIEPTVREDIKLGLKLRIGGRRIYSLLAPSVWLALDERDDPMAPHGDQLWLPASAWIKVASPLAVGIGSGVKGPLDQFPDRMLVPLGALLQYALDPHISVGASLVFGKLAGGSAVMDTGIESRFLQIWITALSR